MRTIVFILALMLVLVSQSPTKAQVMLDASKITCWQFATYKITNPDFIAIWVSGYDHGKRGDTVIDTQQLIANAKKMQDYCTKNGDVPFMQAAETVLGSGK